MRPTARPRSPKWRHPRSRAGGPNVSRAGSGTEVEQFFRVFHCVSFVLLLWLDHRLLGVTCFGCLFLVLFNFVMNINIYVLFSLGVLNRVQTTNQYRWNQTKSEGYVTGPLLSSWVAEHQDKGASNLTGVSKPVSKPVSSTPQSPV